MRTHTAFAIKKIQGTIQVCGSETAYLKILSGLYTMYTYCEIPLEHRQSYEYLQPIINYEYSLHTESKKGNYSKQAGTTTPYQYTQNDQTQFRDSVFTTYFPTIPGVVLVLYLRNLDRLGTSQRAQCECVSSRPTFLRFSAVYLSNFCSGSEVSLLSVSNDMSSSGGNA